MNIGPKYYLFHLNPYMCEANIVSTGVQVLQCKWPHGRHKNCSFCASHGKEVEMLLYKVTHLRCK